jgi:hypothetical protein
MDLGQERERDAHNTDANCKTIISHEAGAALDVKINEVKGLRG